MKTKCEALVAKLRYPIYDIYEDGFSPLSCWKADVNGHVYSPQLGPLCYGPDSSGSIGGTGWLAAWATVVAVEPMYPLKEFRYRLGILYPYIYIS